VTSTLGTRESFEQVYRAHFRFVWRALRRLGVAEPDLPDAAQDVFLVVYRKLSTFDFTARVTTWLYAICMRTASDRRRSARARYEVLDVAQASAGAHADAQIELSRRREILEAALDAMPLEQRTVFTLFELDGFSGEEVATLLQIPLPTAYSRLRLARATFRTVIGRGFKREQFLLQRMGVSHE
jgi:RNA polymerase sigma-70 factor (ECF subfamily)